MYENIMTARNISVKKIYPFKNKCAYKHKNNLQKCYYDNLTHRSQPQRPVISNIRKIKKYSMAHTH